MLHFLWFLASSSSLFTFYRRENACVLIIVQGVRMEVFFCSGINLCRILQITLQWNP